MIRDLNEENQDLTDRLASEQQARLLASEAAAAAARQVDALKMALDIQQRKSGTYSDMLAMEGFFDHSVQSMSRDAPSLVASHLPPDECRDNKTKVPVGDGMEASKLTGADGTGGQKCSIAVAYTEEILREEKRVDDTRRELGEETVQKCEERKRGKE